MLSASSDVCRLPHPNEALFVELLISVATVIVATAHLSGTKGALRLEMGFPTGLVALVRYFLLRRSPCIVLDSKVVDD